MTDLSLHQIARALGGEVSGGQALVPGPGHSRRDRSLSIQLSATAPEGFLAFSHAGDDFALCRDYVKQALCIEDTWRRERELRSSRPAPRSITPPSRQRSSGDDDRTGPALVLWREGVDPRPTVVKLYLNRRALDLGDDLAGEVLRWHPRIGAMLALFRNVLTGEPQAVSRTFLDREGRKLGRKFLGPVAGTAVMLDAFDIVLEGLHIGEGVETCMAARRLGLRPCWALGALERYLCFRFSTASNA
jgi:hypothetical protein